MDIGKGWLNHLLSHKLAAWNEHAEVVGRAFRGPNQLEHHGIYAVWMKAELQELLALYNSIATLTEAGASITEAATLLDAPKVRRQETKQE
jgi:hypothetical protein